MTERTTRRVLLTTLVTIGVLVASAAPVSASSSSDKKVARAGVLVLSDFPADWSKGARKDQSSDAERDAAAAKIPACKSFVTVSKAIRTNPRAKSGNFEHAESDVTNAVTVFPSTARAKALIRTFSGTDLPECLNKLFSAVFEQQLAKNPDVADQVVSVNASIAPLAGVHVGEEAAAYQGDVVVALKGGTSETIGLGIVFVRVADAVAGYSWTTDTDISAVLQPAIVASVKRLQDAQSAT